MATSPYIVDVIQATFADVVIKKSHELPVLVDFWADWCGPCKMLMPVLAKLANEYAGKFLLAKVDTDEQQALAGQHGIRGLPTVKLFKDGVVVGEFSGAQPEKTIRALLDKHIPRPSDAKLAQARSAADAGDAQKALALLQTALTEDPANDRVKLQLAKLLLEQGRLDEAEAQLKSLSLATSTQAEALAVGARLELAHIAAGAPPAAELDKAIAANPRDGAARHRRGAQQALSGDHEAALANFLEIVRSDRRFGDDAGRKAMLALFNMLGPQHEAVKRYRALLSLALN